jgi:hypothetical protein
MMVTRQRGPGTRGVRVADQDSLTPGTPFFDFSEGWTGQHTAMTTFQNPENIKSKSGYLADKQRNPDD